MDHSEVGLRVWKREHMQRNQKESGQYLVVCWTTHLPYLKKEEEPWQIRLMSAQEKMGAVGG